MAASKKGRNSKKNTRPRSATATEITGREERPAGVSSKRQVVATVLFAAAVFLLFVVLIKGQNVWAALHSFIFGIFGIAAFVFPFLLGFVAVLCAMDKSDRQITFKIVQAVCLILLFCGTVDVFLRDPASKLGFIDSAVVAYTDGIELYGGGLLGAFIGFPLVSIFGKAGATVTILILLFVFFMLVTGTTLMALFRALEKPAKKTAKAAEKVRDNLSDRHAEWKTRREQEASDPDEPDDLPDPVDEVEPVDLPDPIPFDYDAIPAQPTPKTPPARKPVRHRAPTPGAKFNIDIDLGDEPAVQNGDRPGVLQSKQPDLRDIQQRIYDSYHDVDRSDAGKKPVAKATTSAAPRPVDDIIDEVNTASSDTPKAPRKSSVTDGFTVPDNSTITVGEEDAYRLPPISLLQQPDPERTADISAELKATATKLVDTLRSFGVETRIVNISRGPAVTRYELQPAAGVKISKITNLADDIALNLASAGVRIEAPIPNKAAVGIEVPNKTSSIVRLREILESSAFTSAKSKLTVALGRDISGNAIVTDIAKMPHGLIAGATGSGKSVCINSIIMSLLFNADPDEVKLLMVDPKMVELGNYNGIPHLLVPVVIDPRKAAGALGWAVTEMEKRYKLFADNNVRNLAGYNRLADMDENITRMPHIVIIIDELADLMMTAPSEVEDSIQRLTQKARAAGMHLIVATQRPSVDVITGTIKNNIPTRVAFAVSSTVDSRTILDMSGAERLMGRGDMLFHPVGFPKPVRVQGCFVDDDEVEAVVDFIKNGQTNEYDEEVMEEIERQAAAEKKGKQSSDEEDGEFDPMIEQAIEVVVEAGQASTSLLQRRLKLGYARAARIVDQMEQRGVVGPYEGSKPRQVLISKQQLMEMQAMGDE